MREVKAGAAFLDVRVPGWVNRIDLDTLDLARGNSCVLGQLEGTADGGTTAFERAVRRMFGGDFGDLEIAKTVAALGFNGLGHRDGYSTFCARLTVAWKQLIRDRRRRARV